MLSFLDITPVEYSLGQNLWCLFIYTIILICFYPTNVCGIKKWNSRANNHTAAVSVLFLIYALTNFVNTDYFSYYEVVKIHIPKNHTHVEPVYSAIVKIIGYNFLLFRIIVWGGAIWIFSIGARVAKINVYHALCFIALGFILTFSYARATLAMALVFTGYIIFYQNIKKSRMKAIMGGLVFMSSFFFHRTMAFAMVISVAMTFIPLNRKTIRIAIICIPVMIWAVKHGISYFMQTGMGLNEETAEIAIRYSGYVSEQSNTLGKIRNFFEYGRFYLPIIIGIKMLYIQRFESIAPALSLNLFKIAIGLQFVGTCFFFMGFGTEVFSYRIIYMSMIPLAYSITEFYSCGIFYRRQMKVIYLFGIVSTMIALLSAVYKLL